MPTTILVQLVGEAVLAAEACAMIAWLQLGNTVDRDVLDVADLNGMDRHKA